MTDLRIDQFKCLIFVLGLKSCRDTDIRVRLLKMLDKFSETTNLDKLVDETQRIMVLKSDNTMIEHQPKTVCSVNKMESKNQSHKLPSIPWALWRLTLREILYLRQTQMSTNWT